MNPLSQIHQKDNYCCFWLYDKKQFDSFIKTKWWDFKKKLTNFRHNYGLTERSALGYHAFNIGYFKATLIPEIMDQADPDCMIEHLTNNYFEKFSNSKENEFLDIRGACRYKTNEIFELNNNQINLITDSMLSKNFIIYTEKTTFKDFNKNSNDYEKYKSKARLNIANKIYGTYDKSMNIKYNVDFNNKAISRIKNSF